VSPGYKEIAERIRGEAAELEKVIQKAISAWPKAQTKSPEKDVYLDSVALNLHSFYSGLERIFVLIARQVDHNLPNNETWHRELLYQMAADLLGIRPALLSKDIAGLLDEFRQFRHLVRNIYSMNLMSKKMVGLMTVLPELWKRLQEELTAFANFLDELAQEN
jgi:hypothetical protein